MSVACIHLHTLALLSNWLSHVCNVHFYVTTVLTLTAPICALQRGRPGYCGAHLQSTASTAVLKMAVLMSGILLRHV